MSTTHEASPAIVSSKNYAKHLGNLLKPNLELSHSELLNIIARLQGAKNWNTYLANNGQGFGSSFFLSDAHKMTQLKDIPLYEELNAILEQLVLPNIRQIAKKHGLEVRHAEIEKALTTESLALEDRHVPAITCPIYLFPSTLPDNGECHFNGKLFVSPHSISIIESKTELCFPNAAVETAFKLSRDPQFRCTGVRSVLVSDIADDDPEYPYPVSINLHYTFDVWNGFKQIDDITKDREKVQKIWDDLSQKLDQMRRVFEAYDKYASNWSSKTATTAFLATMADIFTGKRRYQRASKVFYETTIKKTAFQLRQDSCGVYIRADEGSTVLKDARVVHYKEPFTDKTGKARIPGYYIADNYTTRIFLPGFTRADVRRLSEEMGVDLIPKEEGFNHSKFEKTKAFEGLKSWVKANPKLARELRDDQMEMYETEHENPYFVELCEKNGYPWFWYDTVMNAGENAEAEK